MNTIIYKGQKKGKWSVYRGSEKISDEFDDIKTYKNAKEMWDTM